MGRNAGFAAAVNRGIEESRGDWLAVLNSDVELAPDYLAKLLPLPPGRRRLVRHRQDPGGRLERPHRRHLRRDVPRREPRGAWAAAGRRRRVLASGPSGRRPWTAACFARGFRRAGCSNQLRIVPGRCRFRIALRRPGTGRCLRPRGSRLAPGKRHAGPLASRNRAAHGPQSTLPAGAPLSPAAAGAGSGRWRWRNSLGRAGAAARSRGSRGCAAFSRDFAFLRRARHPAAFRRRGTKLDNLLRSNERLIRDLQHPPASIPTGSCTFF
jgi:hypothetical protein